MFSVRSSYRALISMKRAREDWLDGRSTSSRATEEEKAWTKLWKVSVPSKIRVFLWRLAKQSFPTGDVQQRRNMAPTVACSICGHVYSWWHYLLECNLARCVWALTEVDITDHVSLSTEPDAKLWLFAMMDSMKKDDLICGRFGMRRGKSSSRRFTKVQWQRLLL
jgi:hypothetical protein